MKPQKQQTLQQEDLCRPLIKPTFQQQDNKFIGFPYTLTYSQVKKIKSYLPKTYTFHGYDFKQEKDYSKLKLKNNILSINGFQSKNKKKFQFYNPQQLTTFKWQINVLINIPISNIQKKDDQVYDFIENLLKYYFHITDFNGKLIKNKNLTYQQLSKTKVVCGSPCPKPFNYNSIINISTIVPVVICFVKNMTINSNLLLDQLKNDFGQVLYQFRSFKKQPQRVIQQENKSYYPLNLSINQDEVSNSNQNPFKNKFGNIFESDQIIQKRDNLQSNQKQMGSGFLYIVLGILIGIYIVFKATDFKANFGGQ